MLTNLGKSMCSGVLSVADVYNWTAPWTKNVLYDNLLNGVKNLCDKKGSRIPANKKKICVFIKT